MKTLSRAPATDCMHRILQRGIDNRRLIEEFGPIIPQLHRMIKDRVVWAENNPNISAAYLQRWRELEALWDDRVPKIDKALLAPRKEPLIKEDHSTLIERLRGAS